VELRKQVDFRNALRSVFVSRKEEIDIFEAAFDIFWAPPDPRILAKCAAYFQQQGAQSQRSLTLSHLLQYSLITLAVVIALAAVLGWVFAGRALRPVRPRSQHHPFE